MELKEINQQRGADFADAFVDAVRDELNRNKGQWPRLVESSRGRLSYSWVTTFAAGGIRNTHISTIAECAKFLGMNLRIVPGPHFNKFED